MKLLPSPTFARRSMRPDDSIGNGMDAAFTLALFVALGFLVDRWLGTTPLFMIVMFLVVAVALFIAWKARYTTRMESLEAQRRDDATRHRHAATHESTIEL